MGMQYDSNQIAEILPHRYPFALVDKIVDGEPGQMHRRKHIWILCTHFKSSPLNYVLFSFVLLQPFVSFLQQLHPYLSDNHCLNKSWYQCK